MSNDIREARAITLCVKYMVTQMSNIDHELRDNNVVNLM